jgi:hypothetical protein
MAFLWDMIRSADLSSGFIVEDLKLGLNSRPRGILQCSAPRAVVTEYLSDLGCSQGMEYGLAGPNPIPNSSPNHPFGVIVNGNGFPRGHCHPRKCLSIPIGDQPGQLPLNGSRHDRGLVQVRA